MRRNIFRRYIQNSSSHITNNTSAPWTSGTYAGPKAWKSLAPRWMWRLLALKGVRLFASRYGSGYSPETTKFNVQLKMPDILLS
jgi:hypothetical protein